MEVCNSDLPPEGTCHPSARRAVSCQPPAVNTCRSLLSQCHTVPEQNSPGSDWLSGGARTWLSAQQGPLLTGNLCSGAPRWAGGRLHHSLLSIPPSFHFYFSWALPYPRPPETSCPSNSTSLSASQKFQLTQSRASSLDHQSKPQASVFRLS